MTSDLLERLGNVECDRVGFTPEHAECICRTASAAKAEIERLREALSEISKGQGAFSRDPLTFAKNCIEDMTKIAHDALST